MEVETVSRAMDAIEGFPPNLKAVVQHLLISHHGQYEFGSPKLPMIREAMVFHYLDDMDSKMAAVRAALATGVRRRRIGHAFSASPRPQIPEARRPSSKLQTVERAGPRCRIRCGSNSLGALINGSILPLMKTGLSRPLLRLAGAIPPLTKFALRLSAKVMAPRKPHWLLRQMAAADLDTALRLIRVSAME